MTTVDTAKVAPRLTLRERLALAQAAVLLLFSTWAMGGNIAWARPIITGIGLAGAVITLAELALRFRQGRHWVRPLVWLAPWIIFNAMVLISLQVPSLRRITVEGAGVFIPVPVSNAWPSTARPELTLPALLLGDALFLPAFNLAFVVRSRTWLRRLLLLLVMDGFVLSVFGTLQKLAHASGLYFGLLHSPNETFFATFIYHNHWGAFALLTLTVALGWVFQPDRPDRYRDFFHSPRFLYLIAALLVALTIPLSSSRSCTLIGAMVLMVALAHALVRVGREARLVRRKVGAILIAAVTVVAAGVFLARPVMARRITQTRAQISEIRHSGSIGARAQLYRDTWAMASDRPWFGWGLASYPTIFTRYNRQHAPDGLPQYYEDAHSDWLQSLAETGFFGLICRMLVVLLPLLAVRPWRHPSPLVSYSLFGCALILLYAWVEFPFGNVAVTLCLWTIFFTALRLAALEERG